MNFAALQLLSVLVVVACNAVFIQGRLSGRQSLRKPAVASIQQAIKSLGAYGGSDGSSEISGVIESHGSSGAYDLDDHSGAGGSKSGNLEFDNSGAQGAEHINIPEVYDEAKAENEGRSSSSSHHHNVYGEEQSRKSRPPLKSRNSNKAKLAQAIVLKQGPQTIEEIYDLRSPNSKKNVLTYINFGRDFAKYNAYSNTSDFRWFYSETPENQADHAFFVFPGQNSAYGGSGDGAKDSNSGVIVVTKPFTGYRKNDDPNAATSYTEFVEIKKKPLHVSANDTSRYLFRAKCSCKLLNMDKHPFPRYLVTNENDDPRLGSCAFGLVELDSSIAAYFEITNQGVWAVYESQDNLNFYSRRRVASRTSYDDIIDSAVEYDGMLNALNWYINGQKVWTVYGIGSPPPQDGLTSIGLGQGNLKLVRLVNIREAFGVVKHLDQKDPNNPQSNTRLVQVQPTSSMTYGPNDRFFDSAGLRFNQLWGQGAEFPLYKILVVKAAQTSLYGQSATQPYGA